MVGSGFSLNAEPSKPSPRPMPLWGHLIDAMRAKLSTDVSSAIANDPLMLAEEFEITFGRTELDRLLRDTIPDEEWKPGHLHRLLMHLPWADVFTTNYDTLLERAVDHQIIDRKYDVVLHSADIPGATRPRIVKLHGSFRSNRPFVITQSDFKSYPRTAAPFVNTVQQSIMENLLVLLGFSGTDPNFLAWTGWVRDNLRESARKIYLCDLRPPTTAELALFRERNVIPIDLSPVLSDANVPRAHRHRLALEWLLLSLANGRPPNIMNWPHFEEPLLPPRSHGVPEPMPNPHRGSAPERLGIHDV
jgi:hypothetical protein